jgi:hypothetical protein
MNDSKKIGARNEIIFLNHRRISSYIVTRPGKEVCACNLSYLGGMNRRIQFQASPDKKLG